MCIKGVNRRIIEVPGTDSSYFEKAVLYVRPECSALTDSRLAEEARAYAAMLSEETQPDLKYSRRKKLIFAVTLSLTGICLLVSAAIYLALIL